MVDVVWTVSHPDLAGAERCRMDSDAMGWFLTGVVVATYELAPIDVLYEVAVGDDWATRLVSVVVDRLTHARRVRLDRGADGNWTVDGAAAPALDGCIDVDLGITPATNTLPIRRLGLEVGSEREIAVAWVKFPGLRVQRAVQTYTRIADNVWRYTSGTFAADLSVDGDGLVVRYGDDLWRRAGNVR